VPPSASPSSHPRRAANGYADCAYPRQGWAHRAHPAKGYVGSVYGFEASATCCKTTGELIEPKVTWEIKGVKKAVDNVFDDSLDTFKNWQSDPVQREAIQSLVAYVTICFMKIERELGDAPTV
jgi:hypothetical protein